MARPRSEEKQIALLESATEIVAAQGLGAPTAQIAKGAGVAEGTLFRYFPTKDDLLNELFAYLTRNLGEALNRNVDEAAPLKTRTRSLWNSYIDWGIANPAAHRAMNQLSVSEKIRPEFYAAAMKLCVDVRGLTNTCDFEGIRGQPSVDFAEAIMSAIAEMTITCVASNPEATDAYKAAGFDIMWRGLAGE